MQLTVIQNKIHEVRAQKVMLDSDLAEMYEVETKVLKQAVKRNANWFPPDFMFEITRDEYNSLRSQIVTLEKRQGGADIQNTSLLHLLSREWLCARAF